MLLQVLCAWPWVCPSPQNNHMNCQDCGPLHCFVRSACFMPIVQSPRYRPCLPRFPARWRETPKDFSTVRLCLRWLVTALGCGISKERPDLVKSGRDSDLPLRQQFWCWTSMDRVALQTGGQCQPGKERHWNPGEPSRQQAEGKGLTELGNPLGGMSS